MCQKGTVNSFEVHIFPDDQKMSKNFISLTFSTPPPHYRGPHDIKWNFQRSPSVVLKENCIRWCAYSVMRVFTATVHGDRCPQVCYVKCFVGLRFGGWWQTIDLDFLRCIRAGPSGVVCSSIMRRYSLAPWRQCCLEFGGFLHRFVLWDWCQKKVAKRLPCAVHIDIFLIWWYVFMLIYDNTYINVLIAYWWMYPCHTIIFPSTSLSLSWLQWLRWHHSHYCKNWHSNDHTAMTIDKFWYSPENKQFPPEKGWLGSMKYFLVRWSLFRGDTFIFGWIIIVIRMDDIFSCWFPPGFLMKPTPRDDEHIGTGWTLSRSTTYRWTGPMSFRRDSIGKTTTSLSFCTQTAPLDLLFFSM